MTTRILPPEEWARLAHTDFKHLPWVSGDELQIVVVEDAGAIVACWGLMPMLHLEGLWIDPAYRGKPSVARRLLTATWAEVKRRAPRWVMTGADTDLVRRLLTRHMGAIAIPAETFVIPMEGTKRCHSLL